MTQPTAEHYDVVVVGGGAGGTAAAVGAARLGARTLLIERYGFLGGAATNSQVLAYCGFFASGETPRQAVAGVGQDLLLQLQALGLPIAPIRSKSGAWIILLEVEAAKLAFDRLVLAHGIELSLHTRLVAVQRQAGRLDALTVADHRGLREITAGCFVDASGEASLSTFAGVPLSQSGGPLAHLQPASMPVRIGGVPPGVQLDRPLMAELVKRYNETAEIRIPRDDGGVLMRLPLSQDIWWMTMDLDTDGVSGPDLTRAETRAREAAWRFVDVLRQHPGFENAYLLATGPQLGIRESRRPQSLRDLTADDALTGRRDPLGIACACWPMEVHEAPGRARFVPLGGEGFFDIPHGALQAHGVANLRLAGRVIGSDAQAYGSVRVMGTAFATGHAAGISAALAAGDPALAEEEAVTRVRRALAEQHALI
ncbi:FAD-dependent oxidoreductase [Variovorax terrae]|uniref:FAD-dependent oxidoreductase n=1 Tax=Variovorax terrae TaxID=2923278 RepID=A0A9X1W547_9BURK|nr:FAD-dependent oxidoreductase [Variovorax terrae]MCJ0765908.1 FAD-dependent oxidoreductase [Variovorax terrae]